MMMLDNEIELWEAMLAAIKIGAVILPTTVMLNSDALASRIQRAGVQWVLTNQQNIDKFDHLTDHGVDVSTLGLIVTGDTSKPGTHAYDDAYHSKAQFIIDGPTPADAEMLLYFTSGTTSEPKMVLHTQQSYSVGHFSTLYWLGVHGDDVHLNISSPGWANMRGRHSSALDWRSHRLAVNYARFDATTMLDVIDELRLRVCALHPRSGVCSFTPIWAEPTPTAKCCIGR